MNEGTQLLLSELILQENDLKAKLAAIDQRLAEPEQRLARAKAILLKAKAAYEAVLEEVKPLRSDKILLEGDLEQILQKKSQVRMENRLEEGGGIRPGTQEFVEQMNQLAGNPEERRAKKAAKELELDQMLAALKAQAGEPEK
jgi:hypothetical protein